MRNILSNVCTEQPYHIIANTLGASCSLPDIMWSIVSSCPPYMREYNNQTITLVVPGWYQPTLDSNYKFYSFWLETRTS